MDFWRWLLLDQGKTLAPKWRLCSGLETGNQETQQVNERPRSSRSESGRRRGNTRARNNQRLAAAVQVEERTTLVSPGQNSIQSRQENMVAQLWRRGLRAKITQSIGLVCSRGQETRRKQGSGEWTGIN
jgi:hypothetical protein